MLKFYLHPPHSVWILLACVMWTLLIYAVMIPVTVMNGITNGIESITLIQIPFRIGLFYIYIYIKHLLWEWMSVLCQQIVRQKQLRVPDQWQLQNSQCPGITTNVDRPFPVWSNLKSPILFCSALLTARASTWPESRELVHTAESQCMRLSWTLNTSLQVRSSARNLYYCCVSNLHITQSCINFGYYVYLID
jgi:hypothetical protein